MPTFSALDRKKILQRLKSDHFDLVVIGGGITGCGIALDAAARGMKCALVEMNDFASGTSSKSTKLIHGGLRYLKQFEIGLVREVGRERAIVHRLAPHLVSSEKMLLPIVKNGTFGKLLTSVGLMVYDILAGVERTEQRKMLSKNETLEAEPLLPEDIVEGGGLYAEYRTDDARLTIEIIKTAVKFGAAALNYVKAEEFVYDEGTITGVICRDTIEELSFTINAAYVVSAAGPWVDELRDIDQSLSGKHLYLSKGVHIVFPHHLFPVRQSVYFDVPGGRMIFAIPRGRTTYVGTTDTHYTGDKNDVRTTREDVLYLLDGIMHTFRGIDLQVDDVISSWAGLRPLIHQAGKSASEISRKDEVFESESGLISIAGGKLTGYRKMAQKVVDLVAQKFKKDHLRSFEKCFTDEIVLTGGLFEDAQAVRAYEKSLIPTVEKLGFDQYASTYLVHNYGKQTEQILTYLNDFADKDRRVRLARAELKFCVENELTQTPLDFFNRRTGRLYFEIDTIPPVLTAILGDFSAYFGWGEATAQLHRASVEKMLASAKEFIG